MKYTLALVSAAVLVGEAAASAVTFDRSLRSLLQARQSTIIDPGDIPAACQTPCAPMVQAFNGCTTNACLCTNAVVEATASCLNCSLNLNGPPTLALRDQAQAALDEFEDGCKAAGDPVTSLTLSGAGSATASATRSATGTAVIPTGTGTSQSIFFSSGSAAGAPGTTSLTNTINTVTQATTGLPIQPSHVTISVLPSDETSAGAGSNTAAGSPTPTGASSGGVARLVGGVSNVAVAAIVGGAMLVLA